MTPDVVARVAEAVERVRTGSTQEAEAGAYELARYGVWHAARPHAAVVRQRMLREPRDDDFLHLAKYAAMVSADWNALRRPTARGGPNDRYSAIIMAPPGLLDAFQRSPEVADRGRARVLTAATSASASTATDAALLLPAFGVPAERAIPLLVHVYARLAREDRHGMGSAAFFWAVNHYGPAAAEPLIEFARSSDDPFVRASAVAFLVVRDPWAGERAARSPDVIPLLTELLRVDPSADVRAATAGALASLGPVAAPAIPALQDAADGDEAEAVRKAAQRALRRIRKHEPDHR